MSYFADLTPHTYVKTTNNRTVLNIGWLDLQHPFETGKVPEAFVCVLRRMCEMPMHLHRGVHVCELCPNRPNSPCPAHGNGQIRIVGSDGIWYAAPTLIDHYVRIHRYKPPEQFVTAVLAYADGIEKRIAKRRWREAKRERDL